MELSIEEKAKRYTKVLEKARQLCAYPTTKPFISDLQDIFPELKESEDEKMWTLIKKYIHYNISDLALEADHITREHLEFWLEKQGEKLKGKSALEAVKEEPIDNANKVEPKFKLYDWVVTDKDNVVQIKAVNNGYYTIDNGMDFNMPYVDRYWHLWTIEDAKDGDILARNDEVFIYAHKRQGCNTAIAHCFVDFVGRFYNEGEFAYTEKGNSIHPAAKEQRELLFQKIEEADYKWDANNKQLIAEK